MRGRRALLLGLLAAASLDARAAGRGAARPGDPYVRRALEEYELFYTDKALSSLRAAARIDPAHPLAHAYLVLFGPRDDAEREQAVAALRVVGAARDSTPHERALVRAARVLGTEGPRAGRAALLQPGEARSPEIAFWSAELAYRAGEHDRAIEEYRALLRAPAPPFAGRIFDHLSASLIFRQRSAEALEVARRYAEAFPGEADAQGVHATALGLAGHAEEALRIAEEALALREDEDTLAGLGKVLALAGDLGEARERYRAAVERAGDRRRPIRRAALGMLWLLDGDATRAREAVSPCLRGGADAKIAERGACLFVAGLADPARIAEIAEDLEALAAAATPTRPPYGNPAGLARLLRARALFDGGGCIAPASGPVAGGPFDGDAVAALLAGDGDFYAAYHVPFFDTWAQCSLAELASVRGDPGRAREMLAAALGAYPARAPLLLALAATEALVDSRAAAATLERFEGAWPRLAADSPLRRRGRALRSFSLETAGARQVVLVVTDGWDATKGRLWRFRRAGEGWDAQGEPFDVVVGKRGLAWGRGVHPAGQVGPHKREGDERGVAGVFRLSRAYGYASAPPHGTALPYARSGEALRCVDDPASAAYNRIVERVDGPPPSSAERMRRDDDLYRWVIAVDHNTRETRPGEGSCIFLHVWRAGDSPTAGCTAAAEPHMADLLRWLRPEDRPVLVQLTGDLHAQLREAWGLPAIPAASRGLEAVAEAGAATFYRRSLALVVGIDAYGNGWPRLEEAVNDARRVEAELVRQGFEVVLLKDARRDEILAQLKTVLPERVGKDDRFLFYFAGHGQTWTSPATGEKLGYLIPADGTRTGGRDAWHTYISMKELNDELSARFATRHVLLVFDSCFSGIALSRSGGSAAPVEGHLRKEGVTVLTAGGEGELARDGLFTRVLVKGMQGEADAGTAPDGFVTFGELSVFVEREVHAANGRQTPRYGWIRGEGQMVFDVGNRDGAPARR